MYNHQVVYKTLQTIKNPKTLHFSLLADTHIEVSRCTLSSRRGIRPLILIFKLFIKRQMFFKKISRVFFSRGDFFWQGGGTLPKKIDITFLGYIRSNILKEIIKVLQLARCFRTNKYIDSETSCYFYKRIVFISKRFAAYRCYNPCFISHYKSVLPSQVSMGRYILSKKYFAAK